MTFAREIGTPDDFLMRKKARDFHALFPPDNPSNRLPIPLAVALTLRAGRCQNPPQVLAARALEESIRWVRRGRQDAGLKAPALRLKRERREEAMSGNVNRYIILAAAAVAALWVLPCRAQDATPAQRGAAAAKAAAEKATPRTPDGHPNLSGFYNLGDVYAGDPVDEKPGQHVVVRSADGSVFFDYGGANSGGSEQVGPRVPQTVNGKTSLLDRTCVNCVEPPYKPEYMAKAKAIGDAMHGDAAPADPQYDCIPYGVPRGSLRGGGGYAMQIVQNKDVVAFLYEDRPGPYFRIIYLNGEHPKDLDPSYYGHSIGHWEGDTLVVDVVGLNDETWLGSD